MTLIASAMLVDSGLAQTPQDDVSNDVEIIEPPRPLYPFLAEVLGIEGMCEVRFNLLAGGVLVEIEEIACTHPVFCSAARDSVRQAKFRVIDLPGSKHPGQRNNLVYPMEFKFDDSERTWSGGAPCTSDLVS
ncbi:energy transducer TonB [Hyphomonas sp.]|uniref:energy transducer TonB family protein n=1 Tax=Hyphomonas sp. TaxID=87 RepID=UPI0035294DF9